MKLLSNKRSLQDENEIMIIIPSMDSLNETPNEMICVMNEIPLNLSAPMNQTVDSCEALSDEIIYPSKERLDEIKDLELEPVIPDD